MKLICWYKLLICIIMICYLCLILRKENCFLNLDPWVSRLLASGLRGNYIAQLRTGFRSEHTLVGPHFTCDLTSFDIYIYSCKHPQVCLNVLLFYKLITLERMYEVMTKYWFKSTFDPISMLQLIQIKLLKK